MKKLKNQCGLVGEVQIETHRKTECGAVAVIIDLTRINVITIILIIISIISIIICFIETMSSRHSLSINSIDVDICLSSCIPGKFRSPSSCWLIGTHSQLEEKIKSTSSTQSVPRILQQTNCVKFVCIPLSIYNQS